MLLMSPLSFYLDRVRDFVKFISKVGSLCFNPVELSAYENEVLYSLGFYSELRNNEMKEACLGR
jgi:hypothetical protein